jgi:hypothetical protein
MSIEDGKFLKMAKKESYEQYKVLIENEKRESLNKEVKDI